MTTTTRVTSALSELQDFVELRAQHHTAELRRGWSPRVAAKPPRRSPRQNADPGRYEGWQFGWRDPRLMQEHELRMFYAGYM